MGKFDAQQAQIEDIKGAKAPKELKHALKAEVLTTKVDQIEQLMSKLTSEQAKAYLETAEGEVIGLLTSIAEKGRGDLSDKNKLTIAVASIDGLVGQLSSKLDTQKKIIESFRSIEAFKKYYKEIEAKNNILDQSPGTTDPNTILSKKQELLKELDTNQKKMKPNQVGGEYYSEASRVSGVLKTRLEKGRNEAKIAVSDKTKAGEYVKGIRKLAKLFAAYQNNPNSVDPILVYNQKEAVLSIQQLELGNKHPPFTAYGGKFVATINKIIEGVANKYPNLISDVTTNLSAIKGMDERDRFQGVKEGVEDLKRMVRKYEAESELINGLIRKQENSKSPLTMAAKLLGGTKNEILTDEERRKMKAYAGMEKGLLDGFTKSKQLLSELSSSPDVPEEIKTKCNAALEEINIELKKIEGYKLKRYMIPVPYSKYVKFEKDKNGIPVPVYDKVGIREKAEEQMEGDKSRKDVRIKRNKNGEAETDNKGRPIMEEVEVSATEDKVELIMFKLGVKLEEHKGSIREITKKKESETGEGLGAIRLEAMKKHLGAKGAKYFEAIQKLQSGDNEGAAKAFAAYLAQEFSKDEKETHKGFIATAQERVDVHKQSADYRAGMVALSTNPPNYRDALGKLSAYVSLANLPGHGEQVANANEMISRINGAQIAQLMELLGDVRNVRGKKAFQKNKLAASEMVECRNLEDALNYMIKRIEDGKSVNVFEEIDAFRKASKKIAKFQKAEGLRVEKSVIDEIFKWQEGLNDPDPETRKLASIEIAKYARVEGAYSVGRKYLEKALEIQYMEYNKEHGAEARKDAEYDLKHDKNAIADIRKDATAQFKRLQEQDMAEGLTPEKVEQIIFNRRVEKVYKRNLRHEMIKDGQAGMMITRNASEVLLAAGPSKVLDKGGTFVEEAMEGKNILKNAMALKQSIANPVDVKKMKKHGKKIATHLKKGEFDEAVHLYEKWFPEDESTWYNPYTYGAEEMDQFEVDCALFVFETAMTAGIGAGAGSAGKTVGQGAMKWLAKKIGKEVAEEALEKGGIAAIKQILKAGSKQEMKQMALLYGAKTVAGVTVEGMVMFGLGTMQSGIMDHEGTTARLSEGGLPGLGMEALKSMAMAGTYRVVGGIGNRVQGVNPTISRVVLQESVSGVLGAGIETVSQKLQMGKWMSRRELFKNAIQDAFQAGAMHRAHRGSNRRPPSMSEMMEMKTNAKRDLKKIGIKSADDLVSVTKSKVKGSDGRDIIVYKIQGKNGDFRNVIHSEMSALPKKIRNKINEIAGKAEPTELSGKTGGVSAPKKPSKKLAPEVVEVEAKPKLAASIKPTSEFNKQTENFSTEAVNSILNLTAELHRLGGENLRFKPLIDPVTGNPFTKQSQSMAYLEAKIEALNESNNIENDPKICKLMGQLADSLNKYGPGRNISLEGKPYDLQKVHKTEANLPADWKQHIDAEWGGDFKPGKNFVVEVKPEDGGNIKYIIVHSSDLAHESVAQYFKELSKEFDDGSYNPMDMGGVRYVTNIVEQQKFLHRNKGTESHTQNLRKNYLSEVREYRQSLIDKNLPTKERNILLRKKIGEIRKEISKRHEIITNVIRDNINKIGRLLSEDPNYPVENILKSIRDNPEISKNFNEHEIKEIEQKVGDAFKKSKLINQYYDNYASQPEKLYEMIFNKKPNGRVELQKSEFSLSFIMHDMSDFAIAHGSKKLADVKDTYGFSMGDSNVSDLKGFIQAVNYHASKAEIAETIDHEQQHNINRLIFSTERKPLDYDYTRERVLSAGDNHEAVLKEVDTLCKAMLQNSLSLNKDEIIARLAGKSSKVEVIETLPGYYNSWGEYRDRIREYISADLPQGTREAIDSKIRKYEELHHRRVAQAIEAAYAVGDVHGLAVVPMKDWKKWLEKKQKAQLEKTAQRRKTSDDTPEGGRQVGVPNSIELVGMDSSDADLVNTSKTAGLQIDIEPTQVPKSAPEKKSNREKSLAMIKKYLDENADGVEQVLGLKGKQSSYKFISDNPYLKKFRKFRRNLSKKIKKTGKIIDVQGKVIDVSSISPKEKSRIIRELSKKESDSIRNEVALKQKKIAEIGTELLKSFEKDPSHSAEDLLSEFSKLAEQKGLKLYESEFKEVKESIKNLKVKQEIASRYYEKYKNDPKALYEKIFGYRPEGKCIFIQSTISINFVVGMTNFIRSRKEKGMSLSRTVLGTSIRDCGIAELSGIVNLYNGSNIRKSDLARVMEHENRHVINTEIRPTSFETAMILRVLTAKQQSINGVKNTFELYMDFALKMAQDEVSAYLTEGMSPQRIYKKLTTSSSYDYWKGFRKIYLDPKIKKSDYIVLLTKYEYIYRARLATMLEVISKHSDPLLAKIPHPRQYGIAPEFRKQLDKALKKRSRPKPKPANDPNDDVGSWAEE